MGRKDASEAPAAPIQHTQGSSDAISATAGANSLLEPAKTESKTTVIRTAFHEAIASVRSLSYRDPVVVKGLGGAGLFVAALLVTRVIILPVIVQMILYTLPIIYLGSHQSLNLRVAKIETPDSLAGKGGETITASDAAWFPFMASGTILAMYVAFKLLPPYWVNKVISLHICGFGTFAAGETVTGIINIITPNTEQRGTELEWIFPSFLHRITGPSFSITVSPEVIIGHAVGFVIAFGWFLSDWWILHNLFAMAFCIEALKMISVGTFKTASILLIGLFLYDIFWVFGTDVMVTVAKSFNAPGKLLFPTSRPPGTKFSLLGLGDIVIPGIFMAMTLRFDYWIHCQSHGQPEREAAKSVLPIFRKFDKFYFKTSLTAYAAALALTGFVMLRFEAAQPALLYLVPSLLVGLYVPATLRGRLPDVIRYEEDEDSSVPSVL